MAQQRKRWTRGRISWVLGSIAIFAAGIIIGLILQNVWLGVLLALIVSIGWLIAYESWRGRNVGVNSNDPDHGVEL